MMASLDDDVVRAKLSAIERARTGLRLFGEYVTQMAGFVHERTTG